MSDLDNDEIQATRKLNGLDDELFKEKEIENGEYVRTDKGEIAKVISVAKETLGEILGINEYRSIGFCNTEPYVYGNIVKHTKQLIDLIEDKDIVEIELSEEFVEKKDKKKLIQIGDIYTKETLQKDIDNGIITRILTILSYNQYMANCYKVGGE